MEVPIVNRGHRDSMSASDGGGLLDLNVQRPL